MSDRGSYLPAPIWVIISVQKINALMINKTEVFSMMPYRIGSWTELSFLRRGKNRSTQRKPLEARTRTNNKLSPHMTSSRGIESGRVTLNGMASALTTAPSLLS